MKDKNSFFIRGFTQSAIITLFSRISGFIRDVFIASFLGAGISSDIFLIAFKLPNLFRRITAEGALTSSLLPIYSTLLKQKGKIFAIKFFKSSQIKGKIVNTASLAAKVGVLLSGRCWVLRSVGMDV